MADRRGTKIHVDGTPDGHVLINGEEITASLCGRPIWADMAMPVSLLEMWAQSGLSTGPLCNACVARSGIDFTRKQAVPA